MNLSSWVDGLKARVAELEESNLRLEGSVEAYQSQLTASRASEARMAEALRPLGKVQHFCFKCGGTTPMEMWRKAPVCSCGYCMVAIEPKKEIVAALDSSTALAWLAEQKREAVEAYKASQPSWVCYRCGKPVRKGSVPMCDCDPRAAVLSTPPTEEK